MTSLFSNVWQVAVWFPFEKTISEELVLGSKENQATKVNNKAGKICFCQSKIVVFGAPRVSHGHRISSRSFLLLSKHLTVCCLKANDFAVRPLPGRVVAFDASIVSAVEV